MIGLVVVTHGRLAAEFLAAMEHVVGPQDAIAGICNEGRNVAGLMPHPERACDALLGSADGAGVFRSLVGALHSSVIG